NPAEFTASIIFKNVTQQRGLGCFNRCGRPAKLRELDAAFPHPGRVEPIGEVHPATTCGAWRPSGRAAATEKFARVNGAIQHNSSPNSWPGLLSIKKPISGSRNRPPVSAATSRRSRQAVASARTIPAVGSYACGYLWLPKASMIAFAHGGVAVARRG